ncbi:MAG: hypothetical protein LUC86_08185 [Prevotellaceae bacterium]|nr:hypothetical protein [Prevotellaceae bacterium]
MRKLSVALYVVLICGVAFAGNPCKVLSGEEKLESILGEKVFMSLEIDWAETLYDNRGEAKPVLGEDYDFIVNDCERSFITGFNEKSNGPKFLQTSSDVKYKCVFKVTNVNRIARSPGYATKHVAQVWGSVKIVDLSTGETLVSISIDGAKGDRDLYARECYGKTFYEIGKTIGNF